MQSAVPNIADFSVLDFEIWLFILIRMAVMLSLMPILGAVQIPMKVKVGLAFFLSIIIYMALPKVNISLPETTLELFLIILKEIFIGSVMGFSGSVMFMGLALSGRLIDHNTGLNMIQSINPTTQENESIIGHLQFTMFTVIILTTGAHFFFIQIAVESFVRIPFLNPTINAGGIAAILISVTSEAFVYGIKLAAPVMVPLLINTAGLALIARIMPQINVWLVGMPLKIMVGLLSVSFVMPLIWSVFLKEFEGVKMYQMYLLKLFAG